MDPIKNMAEAALVGAKLEGAKIFALCEDGTIYALHQIRVRPPVHATKMKREAVIRMLGEKG